MFTKRGFTLIETIVVAAIIVVSLGVWIFVFRNSSGGTQDQTIDQEYYQHYSLLLSRLKIDLRSAKEWKKVNETTYAIRILTDSDNGFPVEKNVVYTLSGNGQRVERNDGSRSSVYDFSKVKGGGNFVFRISP